MSNLKDVQLFRNRLWRRWFEKPRNCWRCASATDPASRGPFSAHVLSDPWRVPRCALCREKGSEEHDSWTFLWLSVPHTCCHVSYRPLVLDLTMCIWAMIGCRLCIRKNVGRPRNKFIHESAIHVHKLQKFLVLTSGCPAVALCELVNLWGSGDSALSGFSHRCVTLRCSSIGRRVCARIRTWQMSLDQNHQNMV